MVCLPPIIRRRTDDVGASAVQIVPELAKSAAHLVVYQRTPNWIVPRLNVQVGAIQQALLKYVPPLRWCKRALMMNIREASHQAIVVPESAYSQKMVKWAVAAMKTQLSDRPDLWGVLTPDYAPGCKRVLTSDDYYQALGRANVVLETRKITQVTEAGIETVDGEMQQVDLIVCATGFKSVEFLHPIEVYGKSGRPLQEIWKNGGEAYYGVGVEDVPNFGMLYGPNTNLGESSIKTVKSMLMGRPQLHHFDDRVAGTVYQCLGGRFGAGAGSRAGAGGNATAGGGARVQPTDSRTTGADELCGSVVPKLVQEQSWTDHEQLARDGGAVPAGAIEGTVGGL